MSTYAQIAELRWGRDLVLPPCDSEPQVTASGDWPTVGGRPNLHQAHRRRAVTAPGELLHRPLYGGGMMLWLERGNTPGERAALGASVRRNALRDRRLEDAVVAVTAPTDDQVLVELTLRPRGEVETDTVTITSEV